MKKVDYYISTIHSSLAPVRRVEHRHTVTEWQDGLKASNTLTAEDEYTSMKHTLSQAKSCQTVTFYHTAIAGAVPCAGPQTMSQPLKSSTLNSIIGRASMMAATRDGHYTGCYASPITATAVAVPCAGHKAMSQPLTTIQHSTFNIQN